MYCFYTLCDLFENYPEKYYRRIECLDLISYNFFSPNSTSYTLNFNTMGNVNSQFSLVNNSKKKCPFSAGFTFKCQVYL